MATGSLEFYASFVRRVDGPCSILCIEDDVMVAGSRNGELSSWDISSGSKKWSLEFEGHCSSADINDGLIFLSESDNLHCIKIEDGGLLWSTELEGSSDMVKFSEEGIWATSSVYSLEIQDYYDSAVWLFDHQGGLMGKWPIEGRAWSLDSVSGVAVVGLSRPKCGYCTVTLEEGVKYHSLNISSPVTVGVSSQKGTLMGHSDGSLSHVTLDGSTSTSIGKGSVSALTMDEGWVIGMDSGELVSGDNLGSWKVELGGVVDLVKFGPSPDEDSCVWTSSWSDSCRLSLLEIHSGQEKMEIHHGYRISVGSSELGFIALGDFSGGVFLLEDGVIGRRKEQFDEDLDPDKKSELLRRKIRELRTK
ncbi:MAG: PQQ-binding-like beta-propeller repeat protein [Candidatus Thermoplasmatota archaeon]|nr:PQQ-binding-like beta-propeller repeat protein [Candidatus Thermoplasmatota archaeon]